MSIYQNFYKPFWNSLCSIKIKGKLTKKYPFFIFESDFQLIKIKLVSNKKIKLLKMAMFWFCNPFIVSNAHHHYVIVIQMSCQCHFVIVSYHLYNHKVVHLPGADECRGVEGTLRPDPSSNCDKSIRVSSIPIPKAARDERKYSVILLF